MKTYTLKECREFMREHNIPRAVNIGEAYATVGIANSCEPYLSNMIRALSLMSWQNSETDWKRLESAILVKAYKRRN